MKTIESMLTKRDACELLSVSPKTIDRIVRDGDLPAYRVRGQMRYKASDIEEYLKRSVVAVPPKALLQRKKYARHKDEERSRYVPGMRVV